VAVFPVGHVSVQKRLKATPWFWCQRVHQVAHDDELAFDRMSLLTIVDAISAQTLGRFGAWAFGPLGQIRQARALISQVSR
jgi:hypothetical protein